MELYHLKDFINEDLLQEIQDEFSQATGFAAVIIDYRGEPVTKYSNFTDFCMLMRNNEKYCQCCCQSDAHGGLEAARLGKPAIYKCHSGLIDFAVPIIIRGQYMASFMAGQVKLPDEEMERIDFIVKPTSGLLDNKEILDAYNRLPVVKCDKIAASTRLMFMVVKSIVEKDMLQSMHEELKSNNQKLVEEMKARVVLERALKDSEIKALHAQINPHFLFNVLNTVGSLALIEKADKTQELVYLLAEMLRFSARHKDVKISVNEEIGQVERYLKIQSIRYGSKLSYAVDVAPEVRDYLIPSAILLPFVENSVIHGLELKESDGFVKLFGYIAEDSAIFEIVDNGMGMSRERLGEVLEFDGGQSLNAKSAGMGISNIYKRLAYAYGDKFSMTVKSAPGEGTSVRLTLPGPAGD
ncbi:MAG: sensor histidine kinase [Bacillota bacterium]